jgi:molybdenum cofactor synthesis domain-containing protein
MSDTDKKVTAAVIMIGDEILSGRTQDKNLNFIATWLGERGIRVMEARVVPDIEDEIVDAVNTLRAKFDYVFTSGGIGPTHDDITADSIAAAFGVPIGHHPEAMARLTAHYEAQGIEFNEARQRMARIPDTATLIDNPVSKAPGFQIGNVFVMAGIPSVMQAMITSIEDRLTGGARMLACSVAGQIAEGMVAGPLGALQEKYPAVSMGSYPYYKDGTFGANLVFRSTDPALLEAVKQEAVEMVRSLGVEPVIGDGT